MVRKKKRKKIFGFLDKKRKKYITPVKNIYLVMVNNSSIKTTKEKKPRTNKNQRRK